MSENCGIWVLNAGRSVRRITDRSAGVRVGVTPLGSAQGQARASDGSAVLAGCCHPEARGPSGPARGRARGRGGEQGRAGPGGREQAGPSQTPTRALPCPRRAGRAEATRPEQARGQPFSKAAHNLCAVVAVCHHAGHVDATTQLLTHRPWRSDTEGRHSAGSSDERRLVGLCVVRRVRLVLAQCCCGTGPCRSCAVLFEHRREETSGRASPK